MFNSISFSAHANMFLYIILLYTFMLRTCVHQFIDHAYVFQFCRLNNWTCKWINRSNFCDIFQVLCIIDVCQWWLWRKLIKALYMYITYICKHECIYYILLLYNSHIWWYVQRTRKIIRYKHYKLIVASI